MAGAVATVAEFTKADRDVGHGAEDLLYAVTPIRTRDCWRGTQAEGLLGVADKSGQVGPFVDSEAAFDEDDLGSALDELLRAADRLGRIVDDRALDPVEMIRNRRGVFQIGERVGGKRGPADMMRPVSLSTMYPSPRSDAWRARPAARSSRRSGMWL
ncbi:hypothetical protein [Frankia gtarii]|uniref:hypothetical protein n=1 Tax=Frankia gtarii TaxID=2950102 RepID=UPI0021C0E5CA|nr:hypothetical protein [Frankia gtarii]